MNPMSMERVIHRAEEGMPPRPNGPTPFLARAGDELMFTGAQHMAPLP
jgi:hypothetical protein